MATEVLPAQYSVHSSPPALPSTRQSPLSAARQHQAPASQASTHSNESCNAYTLQDSSSTASQLTNITDFSSIANSGSEPQELHKLQTSVQRRACTPEDNALKSPMSVTSPVTISNGTKRNASGHVKNASSCSSSSYVANSTPGRTRAESLSSNGSRVGELAASLKMRLGYAMTKVQHGWEHKNIGELEQLSASKSPSNQHSMSYVDVRPSTAAGYQGLPDSAMSPPSKRRSGMFGTPVTDAYTFQPLQRQLQPAANIHSHQHIRSTDLRSLPLASMNANAMSPPRTPTTHFPRRPPTIRTDTQTAEAEQEALQALTQLGSPHNSQYSRRHNASQGNSSQASPLRSQFAGTRRVSFARGESDSSAVETSSEEGRGGGRVRGRV